MLTRTQSKADNRRNQELLLLFIKAAIKRLHSNGLNPVEFHLAGARMTRMTRKAGGCDARITNHRSLLAGFSSTVALSSIHNGQKPRGSYREEAYRPPVVGHLM